MTFNLVPLLPIWVIAVIGVVLLALLAHGNVVLCAKSVPRRWVAVLSVLRVIAIVLFMLLLVRPVAHYTRSITDKPSMVMMLDASRAMGWDEAGQRESRLREAIESMRTHGLRQKLEQSFEMPWFAINQEVRPVDPGRVDGLALEGETGSLAQHIETAWNYQRLHDPGRGRVGDQRDRLLLISDGHYNGHVDPVETARRLGVTIYTMPPRDVAAPPAEPAVRVVSLQSVPTVLLGSEARFRARLRLEGEIASGPVELALQADGETVRTRRVRVDAARREQRVEMTHRPRSPGRKDYALVARPTDGGPSFEPTRPQPLTVNVIARGHQVLMLEDRWRWGFRFLRRAMESDPDFALTAFISRRPGTYMQFADTPRAVHLEGFPRSRPQLAWFDTIILGDVNPEHWPPDLAPAIYEMVVERGKSLVVIAGPGLPRLTGSSALRSLLPVESQTDGAGYIPGPVKVAPAPGASDASLFFTPEGDDFFGVFDALPPMDQIYAPLRKRPAANLLLVAPEHSNEYGSRIVMAEHTVGKGRVLYIGTDTLWKWQMLAGRDSQGRTPYEVFWKQTLRALSPRQPQQNGATLRLRTDYTRYDVRGIIELAAEFEQRSREPDDAQISVSVELPDGDVLPVALRAHPQEAGVYISEIEPPMPGAYTLTGRAQIDGETAAESITRIHVQPLPEMPGRRRNDMAALARLARATGGNVVEPDNPDTWPNVKPDEAREVEVADSLDLWRSATLLLLLVGVLSLDWLVRLLRGFV